MGNGMFDQPGRWATDLCANKRPAIEKVTRSCNVEISNKTPTKIAFIQLA